MKLSNVLAWSCLFKQEIESKLLTWFVTGRHISPVVSALSKEFGDVRFLKVDLDEVHLRVWKFLLRNIVKTSLYGAFRIWTESNLFAFAARVTEDYWNGGHCCCGMWFWNHIIEPDYIFNTHLYISNHQTVKDIPSWSGNNFEACLRWNWQPTFQFHLEGKMVSGFSGADSKKLRDTVQELL